MAAPSPGCTVESFAATARGLGADAVGINCSLGPREIFPMAKRLAEAVPGDFPVFVKPNAGPAPGRRQRLRHHARSFTPCR